MSRCDMNRYKISVIVPIYNVEKWLRECLDSLVNQTVPFHEIILVNDGSTDNSLNVCKEYEKKYKNIKLICQKNKGLSGARNTGMRNCEGDYIIFVDSDDLVQLNMNEILNSSLNYDVDILYYDREQKTDIKIKNIPKERSVILKKDTCSGIDFFKKEFLLENLVVSACMAVYKTSYLKNNNIEFSEGLLYEDNLFRIMTAFYARKVSQIKDKLYIRRWRENSIMTSKMSKKKAFDYLKINQLIVEFIYENKIFYDDVEFLKAFIKSRYLSFKWFYNNYENEEFVSNILSDFSKIISKLLINNDEVRKEFIYNVIMNKKTNIVIANDIINHDLEEKVNMLTKKIEELNKRIQTLKKTIKILLK